MSDEVLVRVEGVSKKFCRSLKKSLWYGMQDLGNELRGRRHGSAGELRPDEFWAVKDVSFELRRGECLGLIGRNGAGKTTLLRMLNGLIKPDCGRIEMRGRAGALIALGAGFNPVLTGRENIYVNAAVLGLQRVEIDAMLQQIIEFAELWDAIDSPVQYYSSGMFMRLGFAIAVSLNPDVLLVDEALAVGDLPFIIKCLNRIAELRRSGTAIMFVSHNEIQVREAATRCLLLHKGQGIDYANPDAAFGAYNNLAGQESRTFDRDVGYVYDGPIRIHYVGAFDTNGTERIRAGDQVTFILRCEVRESLSHADLELRFWSALGLLICTIRSSTAGSLYTLPCGVVEFRIRLRTVALAPGIYRLVAGFRRNGEVMAWSRDLAHITVSEPVNPSYCSGVIYHEVEIITAENVLTSP